MKDVYMLAGLGLMGTAIVLMPELVKDLPLSARLWIFAMICAGFLMGVGATKRT